MDTTAVRNRSALPLRFPPLRSVLYDTTPLGESIILSSSVCAPLLHVEAHVLASLLGRGKRSCLLLGRPRSVDDARLAVIAEDTAGGEWELFVDGFDHGDGSRFPMPTNTSLSSRLSRPMLIRAVPEERDMVEDAVRGWFDLTSRFRMSDSIRVYVSQTLTSSTSSSLNFVCLAPSVRFICRRVPSPVFLRTPLLAKLKSEDGSGEMQYGLLTLNETRKAVLLVEDDPLAYQVPVVGVWFKNSFQLAETGTFGPHPNEDEEEYLNRLATVVLRDPAIFAGCVRYAANTYLHEKVCAMDSPRTFLACILLGGARPDVFLEVSASSLDSDQPFDKYEGSTDFDQGSDQDVYNIAFRAQLDVVRRLETKHVVNDELQRSNPRLDWLQPEAIPNSDRLLMQIAELIQRGDREDELEARQPKRSTIPAEPEREEPLPIPIDAPERPTSGKAAGRVNLLVDFISRQQQEIAELRRVVARLEDGLQGGAFLPTPGPIPSLVEKPAEKDETSDASFDFKEQRERSQIQSHDMEDEGFSSALEEEDDLDEIEQKYMDLVRQRQGQDSSEDDNFL